MQGHPDTTAADVTRCEKERENVMIVRRLRQQAWSAGAGAMQAKKGKKGKKKKKKKKTEEKEEGEENRSRSACTHKKCVCVLQTRGVHACFCFISYRSLVYLIIWECVTSVCVLIASHLIGWGLLPPPPLPPLLPAACCCPHATLRIQTPLQRTTCFQ